MIDCAYFRVLSNLGSRAHIVAISVVCLLQQFSIVFLVVSEREEGIVVLHLSIGPLKTHSSWNRYRDAKPVPINPLADDLASAPLGRSYGHNPLGRIQLL